MYPKNITLTKLNTLDEAEFPQREKYPDGSERTGLMWEFSEPRIGKCFYVLEGKLNPTFRTSLVQEILFKTDNSIVFKTINSIYKITWKNEN